MVVKLDVSGFAFDPERKTYVIHGTQENSNEPVMVHLDPLAAIDLVKYIEENPHRVAKTKKGGA